MLWQIGISLFTALCTVGALICLVAAQRAEARAETIARSLHVSLKQTNSRLAAVEEEQLALAARMQRLYGRFYREKRANIPSEREPLDDDGEPVDATDADLQALLDFQRAPNAAPK